MWKEQTLDRPKEKKNVADENGVTKNLQGSFLMYGYNNVYKYPRNVSTRGLFGKLSALSGRSM